MTDNGQRKRTSPLEKDAARGCSPLFLVILFCVAVLTGYVVWVDNPVDAPDPAKTPPPAAPPKG